VVAGETIRITGRVGFDCPFCLISHEARVKLESPDFSERFYDLGELSHGDEATFKFELPAPTQPGTEVAVTIHGQRNPPDVYGGWRTNNSSGPYRINTVTRQAQAAQTGLSYAPWVATGGVGGYGIGKYTDDFGPRPAAFAGAVAGAGGKLASDSFTIPDVRFPLVPAVATAALLASGAFVLRELPI
jgi:hypothetical protein